MNFNFIPCFGKQVVCLYIRESWHFRFFLSHDQSQNYHYFMNYVGGSKSSETNPIPENGLILSE